MLRACLAAAIALAALLSASGSHGADPPAIRRVVATGQAAPGGGAFDRFSVESLPIVAPINGKGQVAFFATVLRGRAGEGFFLATGKQIAKVAAEGDPAPGGGVFSGFGRHPIPALNEAGELAFAAAISGARAVEGIFVASPRRVRAVALAGGAALGIPSGTFASVDARDETPDGGIFAKFSERVAVNDASVVAFNALLKGAPIAAAVYVIDDRLRRVAALGDAAPGGGVFSHFGLWPSLSAAGAVGFVASVDGAAAPVRVFVAGRLPAAKIAAVGDTLPGGGTLLSFGLYPFAAMSGAGTVSFATAPDAVGAGVEGIFAIDPPTAR